MNEPVADTGNPSLHLGEVAGTAGIFALAGLLLALLIASLGSAGGGEAAPGGPAPRTAPPADFRAISAPAEQPILVIAVGEQRATEVVELLAKERALRVLLGEPARDAEVIVAADAAAAESIRAAVFEQSALPGAPAMQAVVVAER